MKNVILLLIGAFAMTLSSCGTFAAYSSGTGQAFDDGIYSSGPSFGKRIENAESKKKAEDLIQQTKESPIYLFGDRKDSIIIPDNMSATIRFDKDFGTSITIADFTPYYNFYSSPWSYRNYYDPWYYDPWYYNPWHYTPWHYSYYSWSYRYDPWYYGGFHDPWYYDRWYGGFYNPYYHYMHPHYCGWYGGWRPHYGSIHHRPSHGGGHIAVSSREVFRGPRGETTGRRVTASVNRRTATTSRTSFGTSRTASTRAAVGRGSTTSRRPAISGSVSRSTSTQNGTYRKPAGTSTNRTTSVTPSYNRSTTGVGYSGSRSTSGGTYSGGSHNGSSYSRSSSGSRR